MIITLTRPDGERLYIRSAEEISCWQKSIAGGGVSTVIISGSPHDVKESPETITKMLQR